MGEKNKPAILIRGSYGHANFGDDALMCTIERFFSDRFPQLDVLFGAHNDGKYCSGLLSAASYVNIARQKEMHVDVMVYGGGTQFFLFNGNRHGIRYHAQNFARLLRGDPRVLVRKIRRKLFGASAGQIKANRSVALGIGLGPFNSDNSRVHDIRRLVKDLHYLFVRDEVSLNYCRQWGVKKSALGADVCFSSWFTEHMLPRKAVTEEMRPRNGFAKEALPHSGVKEGMLPGNGFAEGALPRKGFKEGTSSGNGFNEETPPGNRFKEGTSSVNGFNKHALPDESCHRSAARQRIGVIVRDWDHESEGRAYYEPLLKMMDSKEGADKEWVFILFSPVKDRMWRRLLEEQQRPYIVWDPLVLGIQDFMRQLNGFDGFITARYHGAVFAALLNKPAICIEVEPKLEILSTQVPELRLWRKPFLEQELEEQLDIFDTEGFDCRGSVRILKARADRMFNAFACYLQKNLA